MRPFDQSLPMLLYGALDAVLPRFRQIFKDYGLTEQQWRVLRVLWEHDELRFSELGKHTLISAPSLVGVVDRIIALGFVRRRRSSHDRRVVFISLTDSGKTLEDEVMPRVEEVYRQLEASVDPAIWDGLLAGLGQVAHGQVLDAHEKKEVANGCNT